VCEYYRIYHDLTLQCHFRSRQSAKAANKAREAAIAARKSADQRLPSNKKQSTGPSKRGPNKKAKIADEEIPDENADLPDPRLLARMEKAMLQAGEESEDELTDEDFGSEDDVLESDSLIDEDAWGGVEEDESIQGSRESALSDASDQENDNPPKHVTDSTGKKVGPKGNSRKPNLQPIHLPDSVFAAAAASIASKKSNDFQKDQMNKQVLEADTSRKKRRSRKSNKELIVGYVEEFRVEDAMLSAIFHSDRTLRKLSVANEIAAGRALVPSRHSKNFSKKLLTGRKGIWERRSCKCPCQAFS
jgi:hypothetical protein